MHRFIEEAKRLIRIRSIAATGNEEIANYAVSLMQDRGLKTLVQQVTHSLESVSKRQFNVLGIFGDPLVDRKIRRGLLLLTHLDTADPGRLDQWTRCNQDPYSAVLIQDQIYGLGVVDAKLDFLCKLHALERFRERKLRQPVYLAGTCGAELGMFGARYLVKSMAVNPKWVLVGEPTELQPARRQKSLLILRISLSYQMVERDARGFNRKIDLYALGRSAHGAYPGLGLNAINAAFALINQVLERDFELRFVGFDGGCAMNSVPDQCLVQFYLNAHQFEDFKQFFADYIADAAHREAYRVEWGGLGDHGVRFLPDQLYACMRQIQEVFEALSRNLGQRRDEAFDPPDSTISLNQLTQSAGRLDQWIHLQLLPDEDLVQLVARIREEIAQIARIHPHLNVAMSTERSATGFELGVDDPLLGACRAAMDRVRLRPHFAHHSVSTEASQFLQSGYPSLAFGPGRSQGNTHAPNEANHFAELLAATDFYAEMISELCT